MKKIKHIIAPEPLKLGWNEYFKPTPKNIRRIADSGLILTTGLALVIPGAKWIVIAGVIFKVMSNFTSEKK
jgi:hypothetical protein